MYISNIKWPEDKNEITKLYLSFMIKVLEALAFKFPPKLGSPLEVAKALLVDMSKEDQYHDCLEASWNFVDESDAIRDFEDRDILSARLAISLLSADKNLTEIGEKLAWFFEVLDHMGIDLDMPLELMRQHFEFDS